MMGAPLAVVADRNGAQVILSLSAEAVAQGLQPGQPLRDASAMCPGLVTVPADPLAEAAFLTLLRRWVGKFSPWVAEEPPDGLVVDLTGCAHLFGGEAALLEQIETDCDGLGLTLRAAIADTPGAAWALARFAGRQADPLRTESLRSGDAIQQEAHATRGAAGAGGCGDGRAARGDRATGADAAGAGRAAGGGLAAGAGGGRGAGAAGAAAGG
jgi:protein ImuB